MPRFLWVFIVSLALAACNQRRQKRLTTEANRASSVFLFWTPRRTNPRVFRRAFSGGYRRADKLGLPEAVSLRANTNPETVGGVAFDFGGSLYVHTTAPYTLSAQNGWTPLLDANVTATALAKDGSSGEATNCGSFCSFWFVVNTADGSVTDKIEVYYGSHNTIIGLSGKRVYLGSVRYPYQVVADMTTHNIVKKIGPFRDGVRPFTVNGKKTLAFVNVNRFLGFGVGDIASGKVLYSVRVKGFQEGPFSSPLAVQSQGVAPTPDEKEVWAVDGKNSCVHLYDVTGLPGKAPVYLRSIKLPSRPLWVQFSRDGRFAYTSGGDVISAKTKQVVGKTSSAKVRIQIDFKGNVPVNAYVRPRLRHQLELKVS